MTYALIRSSAAITDFLHHALAGGSALTVGELEAKARAAGLLSEPQQIQHAKMFKKAKKALGSTFRKTSAFITDTWCERHGT
jgi:hypothetical protein